MSCRPVIIAPLCILALSVAVGSSANAQETNNRRERLRNAASAAVEVAEGLIEQNKGAALPTVDGRVVILQRQAKQSRDEPLALQSHEINAGGLLIVEVPDTQSHPTDVAEPAVTPEGALQPFGKVRGIRTNDAGEPMMGGGYTWFLFKTIAPGKATINVKYSPNGGGDPVDQTYQVNVTAK